MLFIQTSPEFLIFNTQNVGHLTIGSLCCLLPGMLFLSSWHKHLSRPNSKVIFPRYPYHSHILVGRPRLPPERICGPRPARVLLWPAPALDRSSFYMHCVLLVEHKKFQDRAWVSVYLCYPLPVKGLPEYTRGNFAKNQHQAFQMRTTGRFAALPPSLMFHCDDLKTLMLFV